jgi:hypothetical protein
MGYQNFATHFLDESLSQDVAHIDDLPLLERPSCFGHFVIMCNFSTFFISHK